MVSDCVGPLAVTADASGSSDPDGPVASYRFDFGDGTVVGPLQTPTATHTYTVVGSFIATVIVADDAGVADTATASVSVTTAPPPGNQPPIVRRHLSRSVGQPPLAVTTDASGSSDPDGLISAFTFDFGDGTVVGPQSTPSASHTYTTAGSFTTTVTQSVRAVKSVASPGSMVRMSPAPLSRPSIRTRPETMAVSSVATAW